MARARWTPTTPWVKSNKKTQAYWPPYLCRNKSCASYGKSHPNCKCGAPSFSQQSKNLEYDAEGGEVGHHCDSGHPHLESCEYFADGGQIEANQQFESNPSLALDHSVIAHGLFHALTRTGHSKSENLNKPAEDFLDHSHRGRKSMGHHAENHFNMKHEYPGPDKEGVAGLKSFLEGVRENPASLLDLEGIGGLPDHSAALGAKAAVLSNYFDGLKPKQSQPGPLDVTTPTDKMAEQAYDRQLAIAEHPLSILSKARDGTITPADMQTLNTIYPHLTQSIQNKTFESLINTKSAGSRIPYRHKMGLSLLLGQPLDATMTPQAMQAIMKANAGAQTESQGMPGKHARSGATAATQKTIAKTADLYKTQLQRIQTEK